MTAWTHLGVTEFIVFGVAVEYKFPSDISEQLRQGPGLGTVGQEALRVGKKVIEGQTLI